MVLGFNTLLELHQDDPNLVLMNICPELSEQEKKCIKEKLEKASFSVVFRKPEKAHHTQFFVIRTGPRWRSHERAKNLVKRGIEEANR